jgi:uncharacterized protein (TIGR00270 family)
MGHPVAGRTTGPRIIPAQLGNRGFERPAEPDYELDADYHLKVRQAREKMGISQDELGRLLNEKPSVIRLIESKKLKPDTVLTRKLMHHMKLNLLVSGSDFEGAK